MSQTNNNKTITIKDEIFRDLCAKPKVIFDSAFGVDVSCIDDANGVYSFDIPEDLKGQRCFNFILTCAEDCVGCEKLVTKCLCDYDSDCGDCEDCGEDGFCIERCPGEPCFNDTCAECDPNNPCPCDQECRNGRCMCPSGTIPDGDCCSECGEGKPCPAGYECIGGTCVTKCPDSAYNVDTDSCVECVLDGHCQDPSKGCRKCNPITNECECCDGYVLNTCTGICVPIPFNSCSATDNNCTDCESCQDIDPCTGLGTCGEQECPPGFVCYKGECIEECNCYTRDCSNGGSACTEIRPGVCACIDCATFSCTEQGASACGGENSKDCICNASGICEPDPCLGVYCPEGFECVGGQCVPEGGPGAECPNKITLERNEEECSITGTLIKGCCTCPPVSGALTYSTPNGSSSLNLLINAEIVYKKGANCSDPRFDDVSQDCIAINENLSGGKLRFDIKIYEPDQVSPVITDVLYGSDTTNTQTLSELQSFLSLGAARRYAIVKVYREQLTLGGAGCIYPEALLDTFEIKTDGIVGPNQVDVGKFLGATRCTLLTSDSCAKALFKWSVNGTIARKIYTTNTDTITWDNSGIDGAGITKLKPCSVVTLDAGQCACNPETIDTDFCKPDKPTYNFDLEDNSCKNKVQVTLPDTCSLHCNNGTRWIVEVNGQRETSTNGFGINEEIPCEDSDEVNIATVVPPATEQGNNEGTETTTSNETTVAVVPTDCSEADWVLLDAALFCSNSLVIELCPITGQTRSNNKGIIGTMNCEGEEEPRYTCLGNVCVQDPNGIYISPDCGGNCAEDEPIIIDNTLPRYSCNGTTCVTDPNGIFVDSNCGGLCAPIETGCDALYDVKVSLLPSSTYIQQFIGGGISQHDIRPVFRVVTTLLSGTPCCTSNLNIQFAEYATVQRFYNGTPSLSQDVIGVDTNVTIPLVEGSQTLPLEVRYLEVGNLLLDGQLATAIRVNINSILVVDGDCTLSNYTSNLGELSIQV